MDYAGGLGRSGGVYAERLYHGGESQYVLG